MPEITSDRPKSLKCFQVTNVAEFFNTIVAVTRFFDNATPWWRGQAKLDWGVSPSLYHKGKAVYETNLAVLFMKEARVRYTHCPVGNDAHYSWLLLMQHYGLPTRLLDWSMSPLVGLFFAVREESYHDCPGVLWALSPAWLNRNQVSQDRILGVGNSVVRPLFQAAFGRSQSDDTNKMLAIVAEHYDLRHFTQHAESTIHGTSTPLNELHSAEEFLVRIEIPQTAKLALKKSLSLLRITESLLFPDLEHLARELENTEFFD